MNGHEPVLVEEVLALLRPREGGVYVDGTLGCGGHARLVLERGGRVIGIDWDARAAEIAADRLKSFSDNVSIHCASYTGLGEILRKEGVPRVDGILLDLGMSSLQLDDASRGFSFQNDGPLDMRMGAQIETTAADLINTLDERELERIFRELGGERRARRFARAIGKLRGNRRIGTTLELVEALHRSPSYVGGRLHPATRVFQALRIAVNRELENLKFFLDRFDTYLRAPSEGGDGGRIVVIAFHSLEDRIVKWDFRGKALKGGLKVLT
ncbi:MAG: 16S rRNA (cytosine(1402)-N(4))-methyltransferase, partial [Planctomycetes bacterium RBG_16_59_8]